MEILSANKCKLKWTILLALAICTIGRISPAVSQQRPQEPQAAQKALDARLRLMKEELRKEFQSFMQNVNSMDPNVAKEDFRKIFEKTVADSQTPTGTLSPAEISLSIGVLVFTAAILGLGAWMRSRGVINSDAFFKMFGLVIVIGPSLFLITAGYSKDQITPVIGLLGTALGFAFGKRMGEGVPSENRNPEVPKD